MECIIHGALPSKSNSYKIVTIKGHGSLAKTKALNQYEKSFFMQCAMRNTMVSEPFELEIDVFYPSMRSDLDNGMKVVLDCLQKCKAIKNDNLCVSIKARKFVDKINPRIRLKVNTVACLG